MYDIYRPQVTATTTDSRLRDIFAAMITPLHDAHVGLVADGTRVYSVKPGTQAPNDELDALHAL